MVILAGGITIDCNLKFEDEFVSLAKYKTSLAPNFFLISSFNCPAFKRMDLIEKTEYFEMYNTEKGRYQIQYDNGVSIGSILYSDNYIYLYIIRKDFICEYLLSQYAFVYWINNQTNSLFIHSSSICYNDNGVLLCAKSGTGKSTHRRLWENNGAICINDDKNVISLIDGKLWIMPNPWSGKHFCDNNILTELKALVFLYQNPTNVVSKISLKEALLLLLQQTQLPSNKNVDSWNEIVDMLLSKCVVKFGCNMENEAFVVLSEYLKGVCF